jgi:hypothetical protein
MLHAIRHLLCNLLCTPVTLRFTLHAIYPARHLLCNLLRTPFTLRTIHSLTHSADLRMQVLAFLFRTMSCYGPALRADMIDILLHRHFRLFLHWNAEVRLFNNQLARSPTAPHVLSPSATSWSLTTLHLSPAAAVALSSCAYRFGAITTMCSFTRSWSRTDCSAAV